MKFQSVTSVALLAASVLATPINEGPFPLVQSNKLRRVLLRSELLAKAKTLEGFAYATTQRNRQIGTPGHESTVEWLYSQIAQFPDYYTVDFQDFIVPSGNSSFKVDGKVIGSQYMTFTTAGQPVKPLVAVANLGCDPADYPATVAGNIAVIQRGTCEFGLKSALAGAAGAAGVIIYNNVPGPLAGTLGVASRPQGPYPPTAGISQEDGQALIASLPSGTKIGDLNIIIIEVKTRNVIAQTKGGDQNNVLHVGAHSDSVVAGPGINDNGSGSIGILEVAIQLTKYSVNNAIRFSWWSAEEIGLLGSKHYVEQLSEEEKKKIRLYLNFDMIASPNFIYGVYDGDGSAFNNSGPAGSAQAEKLFLDYFPNDAQLQTVPTDFTGRSDYGPFLTAGIASGGLFTGAEVKKTEEEAKIFGGEAGVAYDINYHGKDDNVKNLNMGAFIQNTKAIAHAIATYARSFDSLTVANKIREVQDRRAEGDGHGHNHIGSCGPTYL